VPIEYKTHNDSLNDKSSFRNPNVVHKVTTNSRQISDNANAPVGGNTGNYNNYNGGYNNNYNRENRGGAYGNRFTNTRFSGNPGGAGGGGGGGNNSESGTNPGWKSVPGSGQSTPFSPNAQSQQQASSHPVTNPWGKKSAGSLENSGTPREASAPAMSPHPAWGNKPPGTVPAAGGSWGRKGREDSGGSQLAAGGEASAAPPGGDGGRGNVWARKKSE
jgi:hypothetical protein